MNGYETAKLIRARSESALTPIIFMTAFGRDEIETAGAYASGAVDFIFAPIAGDALRAKVTRVFVELRFARLDHGAQCVDARQRGALAVLQNVADGIVTVDEQGLIESVNRSALALFGYESGGGDRAAVADRSSRPATGTSSPRTRSPWRSAAAPIETLGCRKDGSEFAIEIGISEMQIGERTFTIAAIREALRREARTRPHRLRGGADRERDHRPGMDASSASTSPSARCSGTSPKRSAVRSSSSSPIPRIARPAPLRSPRSSAARPGRSASRRATCTPAGA